jgi:hypothetical protein
VLIEPLLVAAGCPASQVSSQATTRNGSTGSLRVYRLERAQSQALSPMKHFHKHIPVLVI